MGTKPGTRALGVAESYHGEPPCEAAGDESTLAGAVVRADRVVDDAVFTSCTVGGVDATERIVDMVRSLDRADVQYLIVGAIAPAWYNLLSLERIHEGTELPVIAVTFEASDGLEIGLNEAFSGDELAERLDRYRSLPPRREVAVNDETVFVRSVGLGDDSATEIVPAFTPEGGRPEPLRVARVVARAGFAYRFG